MVLSDGAKCRERFIIYVLELIRDIVFLVAAKMARLKQAKEEAEKEIAEYKAKTEQDFQRKLEEVQNGTSFFFSFPRKWSALV